MIKLKPCPWCGEVSIIETIKTLRSDKPLYTIHCANPKCEFKPTTLFAWDSPEAVAEAWNTRKGEKDELD